MADWDVVSSTTLKDKADPWAVKSKTKAAPSSFSLGGLVDATRSLPGGFAQGITGLVGLPRAVGDWEKSAVQRVGNFLYPGAGDSAKSGLDAISLPWPTTQTLNEVISKPTGGYYQPQTAIGDVAQTAASFAPALFGGEASLPAKIFTRTVAPAAVSEGAGYLAKGTTVEPYARLAGAVVGGVGGAGLKSGAESVANRITGNIPSVEDQAAKYAAQIAANAGVTPEGIDAFGAAHTGRAPMAAEAIGPTGIATTAALGRRSGATAEALGSALSERAQAAPSRILADVATASGVQPEAAVGNMEQIVKSGRVAARPLYEKAFAGGSLAPLEGQFRTALTSATGAKGQIAKQISQIEQNSAGALAARGAAGADIRAQYMDLHNRLQQAEADRQATLEMFQKAKGDANSNAPGAVWSPRLQQFLDDKIVRQGIGHGMEIQRLENLAEGKRFDPTEYGVTGTDSDGAHIITSVPNMRLLDAGKRGLDTILESYRNPITRQLVLDEKGRAIESVRKSYLDELDNLNPDYSVARSSAADYLSANSAFKSAGDHLLNPGVTAKQVTEYVSRLNPANAEAYKAGLANKLFNQAQNGRLKPGQLLTPSVQQKLTAALGGNNAMKFISNMNKELALAKSGSRMAPGTNSITSDVMLANSEMDHGANIMGGVHAARAVGHAVGGNIPGAALGALSAVRHFAPDLLKTGGMSPEVRDALGKIMMMSPEDFSALLRKSGAAPQRTTGATNVAPLSVPVTSIFGRQNQ